MKTIITSVFFILTSWNIIFASNEIHWLKDLEKAQQLSARKKNLILLVVKDDSCWSKKLEALIKDFSLIGENASLYTFCTLFKDDFPNQPSANIPNIVLIHPSQGTIVRMGYMPMDSAGLESYLNAQMKNFEKIKDVALNVKNFDSKELEKIFLLSKQMDCIAFQNLILEEGNKRSDTAFFAFEKYEMLLNKFSYDDERVKAARDEVAEKDHKNIQKYHLKLAVLEFLKLSDTDTSLENVIEPLMNYIKIYGLKDKKNLWKIYMTISQFFLGKKDYYKSLQYARLSHKKSPRSVKKHIQASIRYLRRKVNYDKNRENPRF